MAASLLKPVPATHSLSVPRPALELGTPSSYALEGLPALTNVRRRRPRGDRLAWAWLARTGMTTTFS
jgi:hypothetical protein